MSIIKCPNCGIEVSDSYDYCIQRGFADKSSIDKFNNFVQHLKNGDYHE